MARIDDLLRKVVAAGASDLHMRQGSPLQIRVEGQLRLLDGGESVIPSEEYEPFLTEILNEEQKDEFRRRSDLDLAYEVPGLGRFRVNLLRQKWGVGAVFRVIPSAVPTLAQLGLPNAVGSLARFDQGLALVTGPTGCGKSTTLAALINAINEERSSHVLTIEDPVEFVHTSKKCLITHREVGTHTTNFASALRAALREDPNVILIGEMRDLETTSLAMTAAETGHLVFATLHTNTAASTVDRIIDAYPPGQQAQIRTMLSESLRAVVCQQLLARADGSGRVPAVEILISNPACANLIREGKTFQIPTIIQTGKAEGMVTMDQSILELLKQHLITPREAYTHAVDKDTYKQYLRT